MPLAKPVATPSAEARIFIGLSVCPRRLVRLLAVGAAVVAGLGLLGQALRFGIGLEHSFGFIGQFDPDGEGNFSTWYSSTLLLVAAALFETVSRRTARLAQPFARNWRIISVLLLLMSVDETAQVHEMLIGPLRTTLHASGVLYFTWIVPGAILALLVLLINLRFLRVLPPVTRAWMLLGAAVYLGGALGMEMLGGRYASQFGDQNFTYSLLASIEEAMEMAGTLLLARCAATHLTSLALEAHDSIGNPASFSAPTTRRTPPRASENLKSAFRRQQRNPSSR